MKRWLVLSLLLFASSLRVQVTPPKVEGPVKKGDIVLTENFDEPETAQTWKPSEAPRLQTLPGVTGKVLEVERSSPQAPSAMVKLDLSAASLQGCQIVVEARVKAENVSAPPNSWNGIKVMLHAKSPAGDIWPQENLPQGSFDWLPVRYRVLVPAEASEASLLLGLEEVTGKAWFDDVKVSVSKLPRARPQTPPVGPPYRGHTVPRLRGTMISTFISAKDLRDLAAWKANHVRWQLTWNGFPSSPADSVDLPHYEKWLESALKHLDSLLPLCHELGISVLIDLHTPPGGRNAANECRMFHDKAFQQAFLSLWEKMARRYKGEKAVWGYDLVNEPVEGEPSDDLLDWHDLALETAKRVRAVDPDHAIIVEAAPWGGPEALANFEPLPLPGLVYSFHMYEPHQFTHQNIYTKVTPVAYPGEIDGKWWDKEQLRRVMQPVADWQRDYNVSIYVGEFSAIRWAPGESAANYLRDYIDIFEENGWDWAYHAFREWPGWSVEHMGDKEHTQLSPDPTTRQKLLQNWFAKNENLF